MSSALHPLWEELRINIPFAVTKLPGVFITSNNTASQMATNISNIWKGSLLPYSLKRILLIYYRSALAPNREQRHMDMTIKKATQASNVKNARQSSSSHSSNRQRILMILQNSAYLVLSFIPLSCIRTIYVSGIIFQNIILNIYKK
jgi:hypothetical protein